MDHISSGCIQALYLKVHQAHKLHPEMNKHLGLQYAGSGLGPLVT